LVAEDPVLPDGRVEQQAVAVPVLGDVPDACLAPVAGVLPAEVLCGEHHLSGRGRTHAHDRFDQLRLAVALHTGDAQYLAGMDGQRDVGQQVPWAGAGQVELPDLQDRPLGDRR
jgi:hypothetical protein